MRMPLATFNTIYKRLPHLKATLIQHGVVGPTHFEIDGAKLKEITPAVPTRKSVATASAPNVGCNGAMAVSVPIQELREPTIGEMRGNFTTAMKDWIKAGYPISSLELADQRHAACERCPFWNARARKIPFTATFLGKCMHKKCGCSKLKFFIQTSKCPEGRWNR